MAPSGMPCATIVSTIGRRNSRFGTGRVMSQIRMQALFLPRASAVSGGEPIGRASAAAMAACGSGSLGIAPLRMTVARAPSGTATGR